MFPLIFLPVRLMRTFVRLSGVRGVLLLAIGVGIGLLIAPTSGARLRAKLMAKLEERAMVGPPIPEASDQLV